jgi:GNAT superfamily N-acetyltransferase
VTLAGTATIRPATLDDAAALAGVNVRSWQAAYRGLMPDAYLDALVIEDRAARWRQILSDGPHGVAVCEVQGRIVGFASIGLARDADASADTGELMAFYLDPEVWRRGFGRRLMAWVLDGARDRRWPRMTLWVLRDNLPARRFYEAAGFGAEGATRERSFGGSTVVEVRYAWSCG